MDAGPSPAGVALIASAEAWAARALGSVLEPAGYRVLHAANGPDTWGRVHNAPLDVVLIDAALPDGSAIALCRELREDPAVTADVPLIGVTWAVATREERLQWLRAGAWDLFGFPLDVEELVLKLQGYGRAKRQGDEARALALVDGASGLYNTPGLKRRARELAAEALRLHAALACVVFAAEPRPVAGGAGPAGGTRTAVRDHVGRLLRQHARLSDAVGWWNGAGFAVLAPATNATGAEGLARRLASALGAPPPRPGMPLHALDVRAGYDAVADVHATPVESEELLAHASAALAVARTQKDRARIRRFEEHP